MKVLVLGGGAAGTAAAWALTQQNVKNADINRQNNNSQKELFDVHLWEPCDVLGGVATSHTLHLARFEKHSRGSTDHTSSSSDTQPDGIKAEQVFATAAVRRTAQRDCQKTEEGNAFDYDGSGCDNSSSSQAEQGKQDSNGSHDCRRKLETLRVVINDGVQGGSYTYRNSLRLHESLNRVKEAQNKKQQNLDDGSSSAVDIIDARSNKGFLPEPVKMCVQFGREEYAWSNLGTEPSPLVQRLQPEIKRFKSTLQWINRFSAVYGFVPIETVMRRGGYSTDFTHRMVFPLVALFFGTGNRTPHVSAAIVAKVFLDEKLRLFDYDPQRLLSQTPEMFAFESLGDIYDSLHETLEGCGATVCLNRKAVAVRRFRRKNGCCCGQMTVRVTDAAGRSETFDKIIFACPADVALRMLEAGKTDSYVHQAKAAKSTRTPHPHQQQSYQSTESHSSSHNYTRDMDLSDEEEEEDSGDGGPTFCERKILGSVRYYDDVTVTHCDRDYMERYYSGIAPPAAVTDEKSNRTRNNQGARTVWRKSARISSPDESFQSEEEEFEGSEHHHLQFQWERDMAYPLNDEGRKIYGCDPHQNQTPADVGGADDASNEACGESSLPFPSSTRSDATTPSTEPFLPYRPHHSEEKTENDLRPDYFIYTNPKNPAELEMSFDLGHYQPLLRRQLSQRNVSHQRQIATRESVAHNAGAAASSVPTNSAPPPDIFQSIFLNRGDCGQNWTWKDIDPKKVLLVKWWRAFSHEVSHYRWVVPWSFMMQGGAGGTTYYCGSWLLANTHEIAVMSGLAAAWRLGAQYPFGDDPLAKAQFNTLLLLCHHRYHF